MSNSLSINFGDVSLAVKQQYVEELKEQINRIEEIDYTIEKENENAQDAGTILTIVLGSSAVTAIAKGISIWLQKRNDVELELTKGDTKLKVNNLTSNAAVEIVEKFKDLAE